MQYLSMRNTGVCGVQAQLGTMQPMKTPKTQVTVFETNYYKHEMHNTAQVKTDNMLKTLQINKHTQN